MHIKSHGYLEIIVFVDNEFTMRFNKKNIKNKNNSKLNSDELRLLYPHLVLLLD